MISGDDDDLCVLRGCRYCPWEALRSCRQWLYLELIGGLITWRMRGLHLLSRWELEIGSSCSKVNHSTSLAVVTRDNSHWHLHLTSHWEANLKHPLTLTQLLRDYRHLYLYPTLHWEMSWKHSQRRHLLQYLQPQVMVSSPSGTVWSSSGAQWGPAGFP